MKIGVEPYFIEEIERGREGERRGKEKVPTLLKKFSKNKGRSPYYHATREEGA